MTLDFKKLIRNAVLKQQKVQHFEQCNVQIFKDDELPVSVRQKIQDAFGADFLADANYTLWFSGQDITKEIVEKTIFKIANKALGEAANDMNEADLKTIDLGAAAGKAEAPEKTPDEVDTMADPAADAANDAAIGELVGTDGEAGDDEDADEAEDLDESVEAPESGEKFVFLKITMK